MAPVEKSAGPTFTQLVRGASNFITFALSPLDQFLNDDIGKAAIEDERNVLCHPAEKPTAPTLTQAPESVLNFITLTLWPLDQSL